MPHKRWSIVLFDLDGTLANTVPAIVASYTHAWASVGRHITPEEILPTIGRTLRDVFTEQDPAHAAELEATYIAHNMVHLPELVEPYDGMVELATDLLASGVTTGVVTSKRTNAAELTMWCVGLPGDLPLLCSMEDTDAHKPDPTPLLLGMTKAGGCPEQTLYVGDAVVDLQAAKAAGMAGIGVTWGAGNPEELRAQPSVAVVDTVDELRALLLG